MEILFVNKCFEKMEFQNLKKKTLSSFKTCDSISIEIVFGIVSDNLSVNVFIIDVMFHFRGGFLE